MRTPGIKLHKLALFGWAVVITAILLLLSLPVLAGKILPALNLTNCWKEIYIFIISLSAGYLISFNLLSIFRDCAPKFVCFRSYLNIDRKLFSTSSSFNNDNNKKYEPKFASYLAGLIEGDGTIIVPKTERSPKGDLYYPSIQIIFDLRDFPLALMIQSKLNHGSISRKKNCNAYVLSINKLEGVITAANIINGYMRTPKIYALHRLIDWLNFKSNLNIEKKNKDISSINSNSWFSGFIDADGHFSVRTTLGSKYQRVECKFELSYICKFDSFEGKSLMQKIANFLEIPDYSFKQQKLKNCLKLTFKTQNTRNNEILINYLNAYPLFSSNFLNLKDFELALEIYKKVKLNDKSKCHLDNLDFPFFDGESWTSDGDLINLIKKRMHHNRTNFNWDHLTNFYNLNFSSLNLGVAGYPSGIAKQTTKSNILNINKNIISNRKYSTSSINKNNLINNILNNQAASRPTKIKNNNLFVSSVIYNNPEEEKLQILADTKNKAGIYLWKHLESDKQYIGSSVNLSRRLSYYYSKNIIRYNKSKIYNALLSYGYSAFSLTILEFIDIVNLPKDKVKNLILEREQYYIDNILPEYNILKTAGSLLGFKHLEDTLVKFKKAKENKNNPMYGKFHSLDTKLNMSELKKGKSRSEETKLKIGLTNSKMLYIYLNDSILNKKTFFKSFDNYSEACKFLNCSKRSISRYVDKINY